MSHGALRRHPRARFGPSMGRAAIGLAVLSVFASAASATVYRWEFDIDEAQVRNGPGDGGTTGSAAFGTGRFVYDTDTERLQYEITWNDLGSNLNKLHLHGPAGPDENEANHLFEIYNTAQDAIDDGKDLRTDSVSGWIQLDSDATACTLESGTVEMAAASTLPCSLEELAYVNVHTTLFPMGEIRGNLKLVIEPTTVYRWRFDIDEGQVRNGPGDGGTTGSSALGIGEFLYFLDTESLHYTITWNNLGSSLNKLHLHGPAGPDENEANHLFEIYNASQDAIDDGKDLATDSVTGIIQLDSGASACMLDAGNVEMAASTSLPCFLEERAYVNVHTTLFPMGEIRGNLALVPEPAAIWLGLGGVGALACLARLRRAHGAPPAHR